MRGRLWRFERLDAFRGSADWGHRAVQNRAMPEYLQTLHGEVANWHQIVGLSKSKWRSPGPPLRESSQSAIVARVQVQDVVPAARGVIITCDGMHVRQGFLGPSDLRLGLPSGGPSILTKEKHLLMSECSRLDLASEQY